MKKSALYFCALTLFSMAASSLAATVTNPLIYSDVPDISVMRVEDKYYMVSTTMHLNPGAPIMESTDLANWRTINYAHQKLGDNDLLNLTNGKSTYGDGSWASSIRYKDGVYYVLTPGRSTNKTHLYRTKDIVNGPWTETLLPFYHDPSLHLEDDGRAFIIYGNTNISIVELNSDLSGIKAGGMNKVLVKDPAGQVAGSDFWLKAEGSHLEKINGMYYLFNICTPAGKGRTETVFRSKTLDGNYEGKIFLQDQGVAQGNIFDTPDGNWYAMLFQDCGAVGRVPWLMPMKWVDGWPVVDGGKAPKTIDLPNAQMPGYNMVTSDEFDEDALPLEWEWNHNPDNARWSLKDRPGFMRITTGRVDADIMNVRNQLGQRTFGPKSSAWISMDVSNMKDGDIAGISAFQKNYAYVAVKMTGTEKKFIMVNADGGTAKEIASVPFTGTTAYLRVDCDFTNKTDKATFQYSTDGTTWKALGNTLSMSYTIPHFMGYRFQMFNQATKAAGGYVDIDWFKVGADINSEIWLNAAQDTTPQTPYDPAAAEGGEPKAAALPGIIQVENYDVGGQNKSYYDADFENKGGEYRKDAVDIVKINCEAGTTVAETAAANQNCFAVGYTNPGEWLEYTINIATAGEYFFKARVASGSDASSFQLSLDDKIISDTITVPKGADWDTYTIIDGKTAKMDAGEHVLRLTITGAFANIDWIQFAQTEDELKDENESSSEESQNGQQNVNQTGDETLTGEDDSPDNSENQTAIGYSVNLDVSTAGCYKVYNMRGRLIGQVNAMSVADVQNRIRGMSLDAGVYMVNGPAGSAFAMRIR